jgi:hypothetical protein
VTYDCAPPISASVIRSRIRGRRGWESEADWWKPLTR